MWFIYLNKSYFFLRRVSEISKSTVSFVMSVRPYSSVSFRMKRFYRHWAGFHEIEYLRIFGKYVLKIQASVNVTKRTDTLHEDLCTFMVIYR